MKRLFLILLALACNGIPVKAQVSYDGLLGYAFSPLGHPDNYDSIPAFFEDVEALCDGGIAFGNAVWRQDLNSSGNLPGLQRLICEQTANYAYHDMVNFSWNVHDQLLMDAPGDTLNSWDNNQAVSLYLQTLIRAADSLQPEFMLLGNEISFFYEADSLEYSKWANFLPMAYDSIKAHSPSTQVGTVFNYEHLAGISPFLGWNTPQWNALDMLDTASLDFVGITLYPFLVHNTANATPADYLDSLFAHTGNLPLVVTETGWPVEKPAGAPWAASETEQTDYVHKLFAMLNGRDVLATTWLFLNASRDTSSAVETFLTVSLRDTLGNPYAAEAVWQSYCPASVSVEEAFPETSIQLYPNPASETLHIQLPEARSGTLDFFAMDGRTVMRNTFGISRDIPVSVEGLPEGMYLLRITFDSGHSVSRRLLIRH